VLEQLEQFDDDDHEEHRFHRYRLDGAPTDRGDDQRRSHLDVVGCDRL
jgi:hypothetical protein